MHTYTMLFEDDGKGESKTVQFDGDDPHGAFSLLERETRDRRVSLWDGKKSLGLLRLGKNGLWEIEKSAVLAE